MWPRLGASQLVSRWIAITLAASIVAAVDGGWLASWAALSPQHILHGQVWRLVTWPLVEPGPMSLVLTCVAIFKFGGELATLWGDRRLRRFVLELVLGVAVVSTVLAAATGTWLYRLGGWAIADMLVIAWARQFPQRTLVVYGVLHLRGRELIGITVGFAVLCAIYYGPVAVAPELLACLGAATYPRGWLRR